MCVLCVTSWKLCVHTFSVLGAGKTPLYWRHIVVIDGERVICLNREFIISWEFLWIATSLVCNRKRYKVSLFVNLCLLHMRRLLSRATARYVRHDDGYSKLECFLCIILQVPSFSCSTDIEWISKIKTKPSHAPFKLFVIRSNNRT